MKLRPDLPPLPDRIERLPVHNGYPVARTLWRGMNRRCHDANMTGYKNYGGRGISVCSRWRESYDTFLADIPPRPSPEHTLDRIDNNGNYEPGNVRWATKSEQRANSRDARMLTADGLTQSLHEWSRSTGIPKSTLFNRLLRGWPDERVVLTPAQAKRADHSVFPPGGRELCRVLGLNISTVQSRLRRGWEFERAIGRA